MEINIYTTRDCSMCKAAKEFLTANNLPFAEHDVSVSRQAAAEMLAKTREKKLPVIDIDGELVIGFDQDRLEELLGL